MKYQNKFLGFFSDRKRIFSLISGFMAGFLMFFNSPTVKDLLLASLLTSVFFLNILLIFQYIYGRNILKFSLSVFLLFVISYFALVGSVITTWPSSIPESTLDYNPISGECSVSRYSEGYDEQPWYMSECKGEKLVDYCARKGFTEQNFSGNKAYQKYGIEAKGYIKCKNEGLLGSKN